MEFGLKCDVQNAPAYAFSACKAVSHEELRSEAVVRQSDFRGALD